MEGPSLVIACEELAPYLGRIPKLAKGTAKLPFAEIKKKTFSKAQSWGKHLLLTFDDITLRTHFLMFGSYRINNPRENRIPKMILGFDKVKIYFYSCAIKILEQDPAEIYDWSTDVMSKKWNQKKALTKLNKKSGQMICDLLMDQDIFSGVGNIIKNEVLYNLKLHPEAIFKDLSTKQQLDLVKEARAYSLQFYKWKKLNQLKRHWQIFRKKTCPVCKGKVTKKPTGAGQRISHFCPRCQKK